MEIKEPNPDKAPKISFQGCTIALTRAIWHRRYAATRHSPEEPAFLEILDAYVQNNDGTWTRIRHDLMEDIVEEGCKCDCHWILAALLDSFKDEHPNTPWGACIPVQLLEKAKKALEGELME